MPSCSRPSRTLRAAEAVARRRAILDRRCARRRRKSAVGAEESLRRGRTKERARASKKVSKKKCQQERKCLRSGLAIRERKNARGAGRTKEWRLPKQYPTRSPIFAEPTHRPTATSFNLM